MLLQPRLNQVHRVLLAVSMIALAAVAPALAQPEGQEDVLGKEALQKRDYDGAREHFEAGLRSAYEHQDTPAQVRYFFYLGLTEQAGAEAGADDFAFDRAAGYYHRALKLDPESGSTMVNLARVYQRLDRLEEAEELYRRAIARDDVRRPAYMMSYAEFLESTGRADRAVPLYRRLVASDPENTAAQRALATYHLAPEREWSELERYLWELVGSGEVNRAMDGALESLGNRTDRRERQSLLTVIAASLSRRFVAPEAFLESSFAESLWGFSEDATIGDGVKQLFGVYQTLLDDGSDKWQEGNPYDGMDFSWWRRGETSQDPEVGLYPRDAFRRLMRSLGDRYAQRKRTAIAEDCYETAATFTPDEIDPAAIRDLVDLYGRMGQIEKIETLAGRFEFDLFEAKGQAYRDSQLEKIYEYHQTLGQIYGFLAEKTGNWGDSGKPNSAIFQLERALSAGQRLDEVNAGKRSTNEYRVDPGLVQRLAQAYEATGKKERADDLRLQSAERYEVAGNERAKTYVLRPVQSNELEPAQKQRYEKLVEPKVKAQPQPQVEPAATLDTRTRLERRDPDG